MTPQEENEALAQWAGIECRCIHATCRATNEPTCYWGDCPRHSNNGNPPDYDRDEVVVKLMNVLITKGYNPTLEYVRMEPVDVIPSYWWCSIWKSNKGIAEGGQQPTIAAAIKATVLQLIKKEEK
jgi:hypothetical protein